MNKLTVVPVVVIVGQVDWAALAQAWIAQKDSTGPGPAMDQTNLQPNGQEPPGLDPTPPSNHGPFQADPAFGRMWPPGRDPA